MEYHSNNYEHCRATVNRTIWTTKDGTRIAVKDMTDSHLLNTIKFLDKNVSRENWRDTLAKEAKHRGLKTFPKNHLYQCDATECDIY